MGLDTPSSPSENTIFLVAKGKGAGAEEGITTNLYHAADTTGGWTHLLAVGKHDFVLGRALIVPCDLTFVPAHTIIDG